MNGWRSKGISWQKSRGILWTLDPTHHLRSWSCFCLSYPRQSLHDNYWCSWWRSRTGESGMQRSSPGICPVWLSFSTGIENPLPFTCPLPVSTCIFVGHQHHYQATAGIKGSAETCQSITLTVLRQRALIPSRCGLSDSLLTEPRVGVDENQQESISVLDHQGEGQAQAGLEVWKVSLWRPLQRLRRERSSLLPWSWRVDSRSICWCGYNFKWGFQASKSCLGRNRAERAQGRMCKLNEEFLSCQ